MPFNPNQNHSISLPDAAQMTSDYRLSNPGESLGGFFGRDAIEAILAQPNCVGLRYYFARKANGTLTLVLCGAEANQDDQYNGALAEYSMEAPPYYSSANPLNS